MNNSVVTPTQAEVLLRLIDNANNVVITTHMTPDGDALGSSLALHAVLTSIGKKCKVVVPDEPPHTLMFLPGAKSAITVFCRDVARCRNIIATADLIFSLDYNVINRIDRVAADVLHSNAPKVMIDHHLYPGDFAALTISHPEKSSTCMLLFQVMQAIGLEKHVTKDAANCILAGMMTDTGNFAYNANDPEIYTVVARLLQLHADKEWLYKQLFNTISENCLRLNGFALAERMMVWPQHGAALISLTREELNSYHYSRGDTEGLVNKPLAIPGIYYSAFFREEEHYIKVSVRSEGDFHVNELCQDHFGGGGHKNAAGGEFHGTLDEAIDLFIALLPKNNAKYLHPDNKQT